MRSSIMIACRLPGLLLLCVAAMTAVAAEPSVQSSAEASTEAMAEPLATVAKNRVTVTIRLVPAADGRATLAATFTPDAYELPLHLYSKDLPAGGEGRAIRLALTPGGRAEETGPLVADREPYDHDGLAIYPDGPVTLRLPIRLPDGPEGSTVAVTALISYMACTEQSCLLPVVDRAVELALPAHPRPASPATSVDPKTVHADLHSEWAAMARDAAAAERPELLRAVHDEVRTALAESASAIRWRRPRTVAEAEAMIAEAHAAKRSAILDFTGASCTVCQRMARTVLRDPRTIMAWNQQVPIEIDTDSHGELADWQTTRFKTQNRPLYVRLDPGGEQRWSEVFVPADAATMDRFLAWSAGKGAGADVALADGLAGFLLLAIAGGLFTLVMPCTYPMIPFTVTFFAKQAQSGRSLLPLALAYAGGIVVCFIAIGALLAGVLQSNPAALSGNPWTNLVFAAVFILLGLSLLGAFLLHLPASFETALGGGRGGYLGALGMGLTFVVTAFACTAPFAGLVLGALASEGGGAVWVRAMGGMAVYGATIAIPFFILAMSPGLLKKLPRAGGWMNEFKVVGGIIELAAALKFLNIADHHWGWGVFHRDIVVALWAACLAAMALYVFGRLRFAGDSEVRELGAGRLLTGVVFLAIAVWLAAGVFGNDLGQLESFLAPEV